ncbi:OsmC family protein [Candidatus Acetothermia bacterium]|nr:OsmC family protein [Candidatus Acetothermia bacterium]
MAKAVVRYTGGMQFLGISGSGHSVVIDSSVEGHGNDTGARPTELLLVAQGSCSGMDVVSILTKQRVRFDRLEIDLDGHKTTEYPTFIDTVKIIYRIWGEEIDEEKFKKAIELSLEKYCTVSTTMKSKISYEYEINSKG